MVKSLTGDGRQALRRAVLRRVVVPDVPQGRPRRRRASRCPRNPTWQQVADIAAKVDGAAARHEGHLPARPARLGRGLRPADHRGQHLRRHLVRQGLDRPQVNAPGVQGGDQLLRRPGPAARRDRRPAGRLHRVPEQPRSRARSPCGTTPRRPPARSRPADSPVKGKIGYVAGAGGQDRRLRLAVHLGLGHPEGQQEAGQRLEVHLLGLEQGLRGAGRREARLVQGPGRQARLDLREPRVPEGRRGVRRADQDRDRDRRPERTRACSRGRRSASSSSTSPSSRTSAPRSPRTSAPRSPDR